MANQHGIVIHITTDGMGGWQTALRNLRNLVNDESVTTPTNRMLVVVNGPAVRFLLASSPDSRKLTRLAEAGVRIDACESSLSRFDYDPADLAPGVTTVASGVAEAVRVQQGDTGYLKLP